MNSRLAGIGKKCKYIGVNPFAIDSFAPLMHEEKLQLALAASIEAGLEILDVYAGEFDVMIKDDNSPLTIADQRSNQKIMEHLKKLDLPVLSEEGREIDYEERHHWNLFWMVDPLDGTKEFIKRNGEFTVNIALMDENRPVFGVIYVPVSKTLYFGGEGMGAYKIETIEKPLSTYEAYIQSSQKLPLEQSNERYVMIGSRSHMSEDTKIYFEKVKKEKGEIDIFSAGSSLKLCYVAEGRADEYPRFAPTMEWDTAAGQGILEGAGKKLIHHATGNDMRYNKENLLNDWFVAKGH